MDVRVIAATHVNLVQAVSERRFREDLYYRLRVVPLHIPPLRERREDLELLIRHFLVRIGRERGRALRLAPSASRALLTYPWPGNVRELENALEYATTVCEGQTIHVGDLPAEVESRTAEAEDVATRGPVPASQGSEPGTLPPPTRAGGETDPGESPEAHEVRRIRAALTQARYRRSAAAELLGISRTTLWRKMREYGI